jgi:hypothetical protein
MKPIVFLSIAEEFSRRSLSLALRFAHQAASSAWLGCGFVTLNFIAAFTGNEADQGLGHFMD